jgi:hypothetical protein
MTYDTNVLVHKISVQQTSVLSHRHTKLCVLFMRCQPLVNDTSEARQVIAKTEKDH